MALVLPVELGEPLVIVAALHLELARQQQRVLVHDRLVPASRREGVRAG